MSNTLVSDLPVLTGVPLRAITDSTNRPVTTTLSAFNSSIRRIPEVQVKLAAFSSSI